MVKTCDTMVISRGAGPRMRIVRINKDILLNTDKLRPKIKYRPHFRGRYFSLAFCGFLICALAINVKNIFHVIKYPQFMQRLLLRVVLFHRGILFSHRQRVDDSHSRTWTSIPTTSNGLMLMKRYCANGDV